MQSPTLAIPAHPNFQPPPKPTNAKQYNPLQRHEIRMLHLQPGVFSDDICCTLSDCSLNKNPTYEALSYVWGDATKRLPIKVNGQPFMATENLESALRHIRNAFNTRVLWVDAVCINQEDVAERSAQIQLMGRIYEEAETVVIWLGPEDHRSDLINTTKSFEAYRRIATWPCNNYLDLDTSSDEYDSTFLLESAHGTLRLPLESPYWTRLWIIQEAVLAKRLVVVNGLNSMAFDDMFRVFRNIMSHGTAAGFLEMLSIWYFRANRAIGERSLLADYLILSTTVRTTDPRDRIYGLLGLAADGEEIIPDYSLSVEDVYISSAKHAASHGDLIMMGWGTSADHDKPGLPSWVSDWRLDQTWNASRFNVNQRGRYDCSTNLTLDLRFENDDHTMVIRGVAVDRVDVYGSVMAGKRGSAIDILKQWEEVMQDWFGRDGEVGDGEDASYEFDSSKKCSGRKDHPQHTFSDVLKQWKLRTGSTTIPLHEKVEVISRQVGERSGANKTPYARTERRAKTPRKFSTQREYIAGGELSEAFCRTLVADYVNQKRCTSDMVQEFYSSEAAAATEDIGKPTPSEMMGMTKTDGAKSWDRALMFAILGRRLFITTKGYIGLGPNSMQKDDKLCVLFGSHFPYILRRHGNQWKLVGEAYAHGIMDGEVAAMINSGQLKSEVFEIV